MKNSNINDSKWFRVLFRRRVFVVLLLAVQLAFIIAVIINGSMAFRGVSALLYALSYCVAVYVISQSGKVEYKLIWVFLILLFPILGGPLYIMFNHQPTTVLFRNKLQEIELRSRDSFNAVANRTDDAIKDHPHYQNLINYLSHTMHFPVYSNTRTEYLSPGERKFESLVDELKKAKKYIFLEYFIISSGKMWDTVLEVLKQKAAEGVDVRLIYDDFGCFLLLPNNYPQYLEQFNIKCVIFNKFRPVLSSLQNNRDHRKIASIDGKVAFTGGINLGDEYINEDKRLGYWKDASVKLSGDAAWSMTVMFLQMWEVAAGEKVNIMDYYPYSENDIKPAPDGYVQPYADSPIDEETVGESVYLNIISSAKHYLYINTPYLVIDDSLMTALKLAAKNGVDVRIVTPHNADKWFVHATTRSYYKELIKSGVKIYEFYGFIHSKTFVADGNVATVGTVNLDFRSLYLHFECGTVMYGSRAVGELYNDYIRTLDNCKPITLADCKCGFFKRIVRELLRLLAPLM